MKPTLMLFESNKNGLLSLKQSRNSLLSCHFHQCKAIFWKWVQHCGSCPISIMATIAPEHHQPKWQPVTSFVPTQTPNILLNLMLSSSLAHQELFVFQVTLGKLPKSLVMLYITLLQSIRKSNRERQHLVVRKVMCACSWVLRKS